MSAAVALLLFAALPDYEREIAPLFIRRCLECHHQSGAAGGLVLTDRVSLQRGGESGSVLGAGRPVESLRLQRVRARKMPPPKHEKSQKLPEAEVALLRNWIAAGAPWPSG